MSSNRTGRDQRPTITNIPQIMKEVCGSCCALNFQEKRDLSQNMKYVELLIVADKAEVRTQSWIPLYVVNLNYEEYFSVVKIINRSSKNKAVIHFLSVIGSVKSPF